MSLGAGWMGYRQRHAAAHVPSAVPSRAANRQAEELYLQGIYQYEKRTPDTLTEAQDDFVQAIVHDPNYAPAYVGLANTYNLLREYSMMPSAEAYAKAKAAAERAVALDETLAGGHTALAYVDFFWSWNRAAADREFKRALALDPNSVNTHHWYASALLHQRRFDEAGSEIDKAQRLDPSSESILTDKAYILGLSGHPAEVIARLKQIEATDPSYMAPHARLADIDMLTLTDPADYLAEKRRTAELKRDEDSLQVIFAGEKGLAASGRREMLQNMLSEEEKLYATGRGSNYRLAQLHAMLGQKQQALAHLELMFKAHDDLLISIAIEPAFHGLWDQERFRKMAAQVGLPLPQLDPR